MEFISLCKAILTLYLLIGWLYLFQIFIIKYCFGLLKNWFLKCKWEGYTFILGSILLRKVLHYVFCYLIINTSKELKRGKIFSLQCRETTILIWLFNNHSKIVLAFDTMIAALFAPKICKFVLIVFRKHLTLFKKSLQRKLVFLNRDHIRNAKQSFCCCLFLYSLFLKWKKEQEKVFLS